MCSKRGATTRKFSSAILLLAAYLTISLIPMCTPSISSPVFLVFANSFTIHLIFLFPTFLKLRMFPSTPMISSTTLYYSFLFLIPCLTTPFSLFTCLVCGDLYNLSELEYSSNFEINFLGLSDNLAADFCCVEEPCNTRCFVVTGMIEECTVQAGWLVPNVFSLCFSFPFSN